MVDELLDLVDENDNVIGTVWKSVAHDDPSKIHREADITVFNKNGEVLIQRRSMKKSSPGKWENTATGHVLAGENPTDSIVREVKEELGLRIKPTFFKKVFVKEKTESKFYWIYYAIVDKPLKLKLDKNEVMDTKWIRPEQLETFAKDNWWDINGESHAMILDIKSRLKI